MKLLALVIYRGLILAVTIAGFCQEKGVEPEDDILPVHFNAKDDLSDGIGCLGGHPKVEISHIDNLKHRSDLLEFRNEILGEYSSSHLSSPTSENLKK